MLLNDSVDSPNLTKSSLNPNPLSISRESGGLNSELLPSQSSAFSSSSRKTRPAPADSSKKNSSSLFISVHSTGPLKPLDSAAAKADSANNQSMTHLKYEDHQNYSLSKTSGFRVLICVVVPLFVIGFTAGSFILISVHNVILLLVVISIFGVVVGVVVWNVCWGKDAVVGVLLGYTHAELGRVKDGQYVKVTGVVTCGTVSLESSYEKVSKCVYTSTSLYEYRGLNENPASSKQRRFTWGLRYLEVPVQVAGGLLFELLGQSAGDPKDEGEVPIVLRSWQAQNFLVTALHVKGIVSNINVLGITEVQDLLVTHAATKPMTVHELIANLACRLARWDDRLFRKYIFGSADEMELKFVNRRDIEELTLLSIILNQEIRRLSTEVIRVKWSLHAREEIIFELSEHLRGKVTQQILEKIRVSTREMIGEQEAVRDRLFTVQDVMQNNVRAWLQDQSVRITHNMSVFGGGGLVLSLIIGLFGINLDGIPGVHNKPYAFGVFTAILLLLGVALIGGGVFYFGLKKPITEEQVAARKKELQAIIKQFEQEAESHAKLRDSYSTSLKFQENDRHVPDPSHIVIK